MPRFIPDMNVDALLMAVLDFGLECQDLSTIVANTTSAIVNTTLSDDKPLLAGVATPGVSVTASRGDHVHPAQTTITGNAGTATQLETAREISLTGDASGSVIFDGSKDVALEVTAISTPRLDALRTISLTGDVFGQVQTDFSSEVVSINTTVQDNSHNHTINNVTGLPDFLSTLAAIESPAFSGVPTVPLPAEDGPGTQIASVTYVKNAIAETAGGNVASASTLKEYRLINGVPFNGSYDVTEFVECRTSGGLKDKVITLSTSTEYRLTYGNRVVVRFTNANSAANPTLNVNGTGAKPIQYRNAVIPASYLGAGRIITFVYDGNYWQATGDFDTVRDPAIAAPLVAAATAVVGTSLKYAREDHVHPVQVNVTGNAGTATKLKDSREFLVMLDSENAANFNGEYNCYPGVLGVLSVENGGTGNPTGNAPSATKLNTARSVQVNLASTAAATFDGTADIIPGITGILPIANGGTGNATGTVPNALKWAGAGLHVSTAAASGGEVGDIWFQVQG